MKSYIKRGFAAYPEEDETNGRGQDLWARPAKDSVEVLMTYPPKLRVNGKIVPWPEGQSPEDVYREYLHLENKQTETGFTPLRGRQTEDLEDIKDFSLPSAQKEDSGQLHPLRKQYLENRLEQLDYAERQQRRQDDFTTRMYGRENYGEEREKILEELRSGKQSRLPDARTQDEKFWELADRQTAKEKYPQTPPKVGEEISRFRREHPKEYDEHMKNMKDDAKTWDEINKDIQQGKMSPEQISDAQWGGILEKSSKDLEAAKQQKTDPYCNIYARDRMLKKGIYMPPGQSANQMIEHMESHPESFEKLPKKNDADGNPTLLDHQQAQDLSKKGHTVVATYHNPSDEDHGHIAIVNGKAGMKKSGSEHWGTNVPSVDGYNTTEKHIIEGQSLSWQFSKDREPRMDYYVFKGQSRPLR